MSENLVVMEQADDLAARTRERERALDEQAKRNYQWLQAHWEEILPRARGKSVAVAGQEAFIADTSEEAMAMARAAHPEDEGIAYRYVYPDGSMAYNMLTLELDDDPAVVAPVRAQD